MALEQTNVARLLANKLASQCHDSAGSYKFLTNDVRRCRNVLEDLADELTHETIDENRRVKVMPVVESAKLALQRLDLAIQSYRCSKDPQVDQDNVVAFKHRLQSTTDDLTAAYDSLTDSAEISIFLNPRPSIDSAMVEPASAVSSTSTSAAEGFRPASLGSSAWSTPIQPDIQSLSSRTELSSMPDAQSYQLDTAPSEKKEAYASFLAHPSPALDTESLRRSQQRGRSSSNISPLYTDRFMSTTLENASSSILLDDDADNVSSPSSHETQSIKSEILERQPSSKGSPSTVKALDVAIKPHHPSEPKPAAATDETIIEIPKEGDTSSRTYCTETEEEGEERKDSGEGSESVGSTGSHTQENSPTIRGITPQEYTEGCRENVSHTAPQSDGCCDDVPDHQLSSQFDTVQDQPEDSAQEAVIPETVIEPIDIETKSDSSGEVPLFVLRERQRRIRFARSATTERTTVANNTPEHSKPIPDSRQHNEVETFVASSNTDGKESDSPVVETKMATPLAVDDKQEHENRADGATDSTDTSKSELSTNATALSPLPPSRHAPPPPPLQPSPTYTTVHPPAPTSVYKIVNADPHPSLTRSSSTASDDLYSSSKPSSPVRRAVNSETAPQIPEIWLDSSPLGILNIGGSFGINTPSGKEDQQDVSLKTGQEEDLDGVSPTLPPRPIHRDIEKDDTAKEVTFIRPDGTSETAKEVVDNNLDEVPPPLPPRPPPSRQKTVSVSLPPTWKKNDATLLAPTRGEQEDASARLRSRSVDGGLNKNPKTRYKFHFKGNSTEKLAPNPRDSTTGPQLVSRRDSEKAPERSNSTTAPEPLRTLQASPGRRPRPGQRINGYYAPNTSLAEDLELVDEARVQNICVCWNNSIWDDAERYLVAHLESMIEQDNTDGMRRTKHLLGVSASYRGNYSLAIAYFLSVLNAPIEDISLLDEGDCAAAYWLGDLYAIMNRRNEALLAYCIAERNPWFNGKDNFYACLSMEQESVQLGTRKQDMDLIWAGGEKDPFSIDQAESDTIIDTRIISKKSAKLCLETQPRISQRYQDIDFMSNTRYSRSRILFDLREGISRHGTYHRTVITPDMFDPLCNWPMRYDPTFAMSNVLKGRLLAYECDLLHVFSTNPDAKIPKSLGLGRMDCFTHTDLIWLIKTIRDCFLVMGIEWSEVANVAGTWFCCRTKATQDKVTFDRYFSVSIFRQALRSGYVVEVCPDEIVSSRLLGSEFELSNTTNSSAEAKQYRKRIRNFLEAAAKNYNGHLASSSRIASQRQRGQSLEAASSRLAT